MVGASCGFRTGGFATPLQPMRKTANRNAVETLGNFWIDMGHLGKHKTFPNSGEKEAAHPEFTDC
jgi:hypothetical protein